jgi:hypothetical protein
MAWVSLVEELVAGVLAVFGRKLDLLTAGQVELVPPDEFGVLRVGKCGCLEPGLGLVVVN